MTTEAYAASLNNRVGVGPEVWVAVILGVIQLIQGCKDTPDEAVTYLKSAKGMPRRRVVIAAMLRRVWNDKDLPRRKFQDALAALVEEAENLTTADVRRMYKEADRVR